MAKRLPCQPLYQDVLKAYEDREYWKNGANLLRHFQRTETDA